jgi:hypothetical protein
MIFRARQFEFVFPRPALVMGIVNVTPDSFSDGGKFLEADAAVDHALKLVAQGADILDIGGESTRPGAEPVGEAEELRRVIPVIEKLAPQIKASPPSPAPRWPPARALSTTSPPPPARILRCGKLSPNTAPATSSCTRRVRHPRCRKIRTTRTSCTTSADSFPNGLARC